MSTIIGIPIESDQGLQSKISGHFGQAPFYLLYDNSTKSSKVIPNTSNHFGGKEHPPVLLKNAGVHIVIVGNMGQNARKIFEKNNIKVYYGAQSNYTVSEILNLYTEGKLSLIPPDDGHHHHEHEHGEHK